MPSSGWPTQNKLNGSFADFCTFLTHAVLSSFLFCLIVIVCVCVFVCTHAHAFIFCFYLCLEREKVTPWLGWLRRQLSGKSGVRGM